MARFVDGPCPKCDPYNPDESCPECHGSGMVGRCDESRISNPRTETPWSKALAAALIRNGMTLRKAGDMTGLSIVRLSQLKNGEAAPTSEEGEILEWALGVREIGEKTRTLSEEKSMSIIEELFDECVRDPEAFRSKPLDPFYEDVAATFDEMEKMIRECEKEEKAMKEQAMDITRLSYWFPKLEAAGLPVPRTSLVPAGRDELRDIFYVFDGKNPEGPAFELADRIKVAADKFGYPCFLRTDHTSGKHQWDRTCFLTNGENILHHIAAIIEFWECVNMFAPPCDMWAVREFLPTIPVGVCKNYGNMPICREFRFFVDGANIKCWHPYWPLKALEQGGAFYNGAFDYDAFCRAGDCIEELYELASSAGAAIGGQWSVDLLETKHGWFITDMAEAHKSYHWEECPKAGR